MLNILRRFKQDKSGVAAVEMALIFPIFLVFFYATAELSHYNLQERRAKMAVDFAAEYMSRDTDGVMTIQERHTVEDIWMMVNSSSYLADTPRGGAWANGYSRSLASVGFQKKVPGCQGLNCEYVPDVQWSFLFKDIIAQPIKTACQLEIVSNKTRLTGHNIPKGVVGRSPVVIADFVYKYKPLADISTFREKEIHVNAIKQVRGTLPLQHSTEQFVTRC